MPKESGLWGWLAKAKRTLKSSLHIHRIENSVMAGMPDVEGFLEDGGQFWFELKSKDRPARPDTPVRFPMEKRQAQVRWLQKRWALGGKAFLLCQVGRGAERQIYLIPGKFAPQVRSGLNEAQLREISVYVGGGYKLDPAEVIRAGAHFM